MHKVRMMDNILSVIRRVLKAERYSRDNAPERMVLENWPEDLQIDIRRHIFKFLRKVCI